MQVASGTATGTAFDLSSELCAGHTSARLGVIEANESQQGAAFDAGKCCSRHTGRMNIIRQSALVNT